MNMSPLAIVIEAGAGMILGVIGLAGCAVGGAATGPAGVQATIDPMQMTSMANGGTARVETLTGNLWVTGRKCFQRRLSQRPGFFVVILTTPLLPR
ncbi:MAG: hypothetical protein ABJC63_14650, partial [Gemmatimonadales bacterium]